MLDTFYHDFGYGGRAPCGGVSRAGDSPEATFRLSISESDRHRRVAEEATAHAHREAAAYARTWAKANIPVPDIAVLLHVWPQRVSQLSAVGERPT
jgi:hypothetical protein